MAQYQLVTSCGYVGCETYHDIPGDFNSEEEALEAFGGEEEAMDQAYQDVEPGFHIELVEE